MNIQNTTNATQAATLNENELFENFMQSSIKLKTRRKKPLYMSVSDMIGGFLDEGLEDFCERLVTQGSDDDPSGAIREALYEVSALQKQLQDFYNAFENFKSEHLIDDKGREERYSVPTVAEAA